MLSTSKDEHQSQSVKSIFLKLTIAIVFIVVVILIIKECSKTKCDICDKEATKVLNAVITYDLCDEHYRWMKGDSYSNSILDYQKTQGMNGTYRYRCTKQCDESCGNGCKSCVREKTKCQFEYKSSDKDIGWSGCPDCGDLTHEEWYDWYKKKLGN